MDSVRDALLSYLEEQARWREIKADEYPEDERNVRSARALRAVGAYVERIPDDDARLVLLRGVAGDYLDGSDVPLMPGEAASRLAARCGFDSRAWTDGASDRWLSDFVDALVREWADDADDAVRWEGLQP